MQVQFEQPHALTVFVRGENLAGCSVGVSQAGEETPSFGFSPMMNFYYGGGDSRYEAVEDGKARFARLAPGLWEVTLYGPTSIVLAEQRVRIEASDAEIELAAPPTYELVVHVPGATESNSLHLTRLKPDGTPDDTTSAYAQIEADSRARFRGLPGGRYRMMSWDGSNTTDVTVPSGEVRFEVQPVDAMQVALSDPDGRLARAGLQAGDLVTAVGGTELTAENLWTVFWQGFSQERVEITIRRGEQVLTIPVQGLGPYLNTPTQLGGSFNPTTRN